MKYLLFSILTLMLASCSSYYKNLQPVMADTICIDRIKPDQVATAWFDAGVDVIGKHLSGLLLIKEMPDRSVRVVFTNETGLTFFDFEFEQEGTFHVKRIINQLDKKPVIETLRKDFYLLLGFPFRQELKAWLWEDERYFGITKQGERLYFTTTTDCSTLGALEAGSKLKRKVSITLEGNDTARPEKIVIKHFTFNMTITLKKINKDVNQ